MTSAALQTFVSTIDTVGAPRSVTYIERVAGFNATANGPGPTGIDAFGRLQPAVVAALHLRPSITEISFETTFAT